MLLWIIRPLRLCAAAIRSNDSPQQIAMGCAMGAILGLLPKGNLTAAIVGVLILSTRVNYAAAAMAVFSFSWLALLLDPLADRLGYALLTWSTLEPIFGYLFQLPFARWTELNNSVVLGQVVVGCLFFYPIYRLSRHLVDRHGNSVADRVKSWRVYQVLFGTDLAGSWRLR